MQTLLNPRFEIAAASVLGTDHRRTERGNQDAFVVRRVGDVVVAVVADGCSGGRRSEVGAVLGAELYARATLDAVLAGEAADSPASLDAIEEKVASEIRGWLPRMANRASALVTDCFLFTIVCAVITEHRATVTAIGDGVAVIDGVPRVLGPFRENRPPYLGYRVLACAEESAATNPRPMSTVVFSGASSEIRELIIGTDGATPLLEGQLARIANDERIYRNPDGLRRLLREWNREVISVDWEAQRVIKTLGPLSDDATLVMLRRAS